MDGAFPPADSAGSEDPSGGGALRRTEICYDATLILRHGMRTPVGLVRVEHYVAEFLASDPTLDVEFLVFDIARTNYRRMTNTERAEIRHILFDRYKTGANDECPDTRTDVGGSPSRTSPKRGAFGSPAGEGRARPWLRAFSAPVRLQPEQFHEILTAKARRLLPVAAAAPPYRRAISRIARRMLLAAARGYYSAVRAAYAAAMSLREKAAFLSRPDRDPMADPFEDGARRWNPISRPALAKRFKRGDVLISIGNLWDYMDYGYLNRISGADGVRLVAVIHDVIAMEFPYVTPGPPQLYHRHWVELGHAAAHLIATTQHTLEAYRRFIAAPNDLSPPMSQCFLPNILKARAADIGEVPVAGLGRHPFVVYCSTIEPRKNHALLLTLWDRLLRELGHERLPDLVFAGKWGWGTENVRLMHQRDWRLRSRVRILDDVSDAELIWLYRNARFTVFPSISEGFGLAAAESLSFGTPAVVSNCPALIEAVEGRMPALDPIDGLGWYAELRELILNDTYLAELRDRAAGYLGPGHDSFGSAVRDAALAVTPPPQPPAPRPEPTRARLRAAKEAASS